jgi:PPP family 3-phenylpropionic acid transporter
MERVKERVKADAIALRLSIISGTMFIANGMHLPYFPVWLAARGLTDTEIAAVLAAPLILRVLITPLIAFAADKRGIAVTLACCALTLFCGYLGLGFVAGFTLIFIGAALVATAQGSIPALVDALTLAEIRRLENVGCRRLEYGRVRVFASISVLSMMLLSGPIVSFFPGEKIIWALALIAFIPASTGIFVAARSRPVRLNKSAQGGLTADGAHLRVALICIAAAALVQASHAQIYTFGTLHWRAMGFSPGEISLAWATGVCAESILFVAIGRYLGGARNAAILLLAGALGASLRWFLMSMSPSAVWMIPLQAMHGLSFGATYLGSVLLLSSMAGPNHRARMQGWLSAASALTTASATLISGKLTSLYGEGAYLAMVALAGTGLMLAIVMWVLKGRLERVE